MDEKKYLLRILRRGIKIFGGYNNATMFIVCYFCIELSDVKNIVFQIYMKFLLEFMFIMYYLFEFVIDLFLPTRPLPGLLFKSDLSR